MDFVDKQNMILLTDLYELSMCASYFDSGKQKEIATFDLFIRKLPPNRSYYIFAGLEQILHFLEQIHFSEKQLKFLQKIGFKEEFLNYLQNFIFSGNVNSVPEGTIVFPDEPLIRVTAPIIEAQMVETFLLNSINLQTMIATKASRIVEAAKGRPVIDFGLRRCQGTDAGMKAARSSFIAGFLGTSNVLAGWKYGIPIFGTMAHSFVQSFNKEIDAFRTFYKTFPDKSTFLVDTYDTIEGVKKAVIVAKEMEKLGYKLRGIRLDSGDLNKLSKKSRTILDENGLSYVEIFVSGDLDEYKISKFVVDNAPIDSFGVGTRMVTSVDRPYVDVVYKLSEIMKDEKATPVLKLSEGKSTLPGRKDTFRQIDENGHYVKDIIGLEDEKFEGALLNPVMVDGKIKYDLPTLKAIQANTIQNLSNLPEKYKKLESAQKYPVEISDELENLLKKIEKKITNIN
jgi:nicotinate phosphoribosyltransferase